MISDFVMLKNSMFTWKNARFMIFVGQYNNPKIIKLFCLKFIIRLTGVLQQYGLYVVLHTTYDFCLKCIIRLTGVPRLFHYAN